MVQIKTPIDPNRIPIEVTARHIHPSKEDLETFFGKGYKLKKLKNLSQPGEFAAEEMVTLKTKKAVIKNVRLLGPVRKRTQVEISKTDAYWLGLNPPIRDSEELDLDGTEKATLLGPKGKVDLEKGVILEWRHIHMNNLEALELGLTDGQIVKIDIDGPRGLIFENVYVRVRADFKLAMHIDTDEGNAAGIDKKGFGKLII